MTTGLKKVLDGFMADLTSKTDGETGARLADGVVITIDGDTPKTPLDANGWGDGTPMGSNWVYVYGAGKLRTGWFGGIDRTGAVTGFDPTTGKPQAYNGALQARAVCAAVAYAIARGNLDLSAALHFRQVDFRGLTAA
jgi:hypothetical protein